jgi:hypothetical protein
MILTLIILGLLLMFAPHVAAIVIGCIVLDVALNMLLAYAPKRKE